jgi:hypothetical protein
VLRRHAITVLALCSQLILAGCITEFFREAEFNLAAESRLPRWFELPQGISRAQCSILFTIYGPNHMRMRLYGPDGAKLGDVRPTDEGSVDQTELGGPHTADVVADMYPS